MEINLFHSTQLHVNKLKGFLKEGKLKPNREYPMILRRDVYRADTKLTPYWLKIPMGLEVG
jgi:hypothetical protein